MATQGFPGTTPHSRRADVGRAVMVFLTSRHLVIATHIEGHLASIINAGSPLSLSETENKSLPKLLTFVRSIRVAE